MGKNIKIHENSWEFDMNTHRKEKPKLDSPLILDSEIIIPKDKVLLSATDIRGIIMYCNKDFVDISGYEEWELAGSPHNIIRHPDMPRVIFRFMWQRIQNGYNIIAIVKNLAKSGKYYWVMTDFVIKEDDQGKIIGYKAYRKPAPRKAIETVIPLYKKLRDIEDSRGIDASENYLVGFLDAKNTTYDDFIENLIIDNVNIKENELEEKNTLNKTEKKSFFKNLFGN